MSKFLERPDRTELRDKVAALFVGVHKDDPLWAKVCDAFEWDNVWPVVDSDLELTGKVVEVTDDYFPVYPDWDVVISGSDARGANWIVDADEGHARPRKKEGKA